MVLVNVVILQCARFTTYTRIFSSVQLLVNELVKNSFIKQASS